MKTELDINLRVITSVNEYKMNDIEEVISILNDLIKNEKEVSCTFDFVLLDTDSAENIVDLIVELDNRIKKLKIISTVYDLDSDRNVIRLTALIKSRLMIYDTPYKKTNIKFFNILTNSNVEKRLKYVMNEEFRKEIKTNKIYRNKKETFKDLYILFLVNSDNNNDIVLPVKTLSYIIDNEVPLILNVDNEAIRKYDKIINIHKEKMKNSIL